MRPVGWGGRGRMGKGRGSTPFLEKRSKKLFQIKVRAHTPTAELYGEAKELMKFFCFFVFKQRRL